MSLLQVNNLEVEFPLLSGNVKALKDISFSLDKGERIGIVGESGAGKSVTAFAILNLISKPGRITNGSIWFDGANLADMDRDQIRNIRGNKISMIFQDPMMTLNPVLTISTQMVECLQAHRNLPEAEAKKIAVEKLRAVQIPAPETRLDQYPHELSGGMRQRVVIAIALISDPALIIADEPTTALDVTIRAEILQLLLELCMNFNVGLILITHDLGVVSQVTQRTLVMYAGSIIEQGPTRELIRSPLHPYTQGLIGALPEQTTPGSRLNQIPGVMPSLQDIPEGCAFHPRCTLAVAKCQHQIPELKGKTSRLCACHLVDDADA